MGVGATVGLIPRTRPQPFQQIQPEEENSNSEFVFQVHLKEMLQQLLAMLTSAMVLSPQMLTSPSRDSQPHGPKER